jgi:hypothetical protein
LDAKIYRFASKMPVCKGIFTFSLQDKRALDVTQEVTDANDNFSFDRGKAIKRTCEITLKILIINL